MPISSLKRLCEQHPTTITSSSQKSQTNLSLRPWRHMWRHGASRSANLCVSGSLSVWCNHASMYVVPYKPETPGICPSVSIPTSLNLVCIRTLYRKKIPPFPMSREKTYNSDNKRRLSRIRSSMVKPDSNSSFAFFRSSINCSLS